MYLILLLLALSSLIRATPSINLLINAQVPPVAQVNQSYCFIFAPSTFSDTNSINYSLSNSNNWLQLDGSNRTFYGTPGPQDVGSSVVMLVATDDTGSVSMPMTLVVSADSGPGLGTPVAAQLPAYGAFSSPDSLLVTPGTALSLVFSNSTFTDTNENTSYYAKSADNTPLPSWVTFNPANLSFSGQVPQATSSSELPMTVGIKLTASNVIGFAQAVAPFLLVIQSHLFAFGNTMQIINVMPGSPVTYNLLGDLSLDSQPVTASDVNQASTNAPSWLSLDQSSLVLSGTPPADVPEQNFTVSATDHYGDPASTIVLLQSTANSSLDILMPFPTLNATIGASFNHSLNASFACDPNSASVNISINPGAAAGWLTYNSTDMALQGNVPGSLKPQSVQVTVTASQGNQSQSENLSLILSCANGTKCPDTDTNGAGRNTTTTGASGVEVSKDRGRIAAAVIVPVLAVIVAVLLLCCCCRKKCQLRIKFEEKRKKFKVEREKKKDDRKEKKDEMRKKIISGPQQEHNNHGQAGIHPQLAETFDVDQEKAVAPSIDLEPGGPAAASPVVPNAFNIRHANQKRGSVKSARARFSVFRLSKGSADSNDQGGRPDSWQRYVRGLEPRGPKAAGIPEFSLIPEEQSPQESDAGKSRFQPTMTMVSGPSIGTEVSVSRKLSKQRKRVSGIFSAPRASGLGHGRNGISQGTSSIFARKGVGHGDASQLGGPPGYGVVRKSWRNLSVISWTTTQSPPNSSDPVIWDKLERRPTHKSSVSVMSPFPDPPSTNTMDRLSRPQTIHETVYGEGAEISFRPIRPLPRSHVPSKRESPSPSPFISGTDNEPLQVFHKRRRQQGSFHNPFLSAGPSSSRVSSLKTPVPRIRGTDGITPLSLASQNKTSMRSYSQSSSLGSEFKASPPRISNEQSLPQHKKGARNYNFTTRVLSPLHFNRSSRGFRRSSSSSNSTDSRFESAPSELGYNEGLHEETDDEGNKVWKYAEHPNPLRLNSTDVTDDELIESLKADGQYSAAQRLSVLRAKAEGISPEDFEEDANIEVSSPLGKKWRQNTGLKHGDPSNTSVRGIIRDAGESAFV